MDSQRITRRRVLGSLGVAGVVGLAGCGGDGGSDDGPGDGSDDGSTDDQPGGTPSGEGDGTLRLGFLNDFSGAVPYYGEQQLQGFLSGLAYKADGSPLDHDGPGDYDIEVGDTTIELLVRDTQFQPGEAQSIASDLVQSEGVDWLVGVSSSSGAQRVISNVMRPANVPFLAGPAAASTLTNGNCDELLFRANENAAMDARSGGIYIAEETDIETVALFGADNDFGRDVVDNYQAVLEANDVEIADVQQYFPQGYSQWDEMFVQAEEAGADGMVAGFTAATLIPFGQAMLASDTDIQLFGGFASNLTISAIGDLLQGELGEDFTREDLQDAQFGPFTTRYHWNQYDNEINQWFIDEYTPVYGIVPDLFTSGAFAGASSMIQAVEESGSTDAMDIRDAMVGMTIAETPKGEDAYRYQEANNQAASEMTVAEVIPTETEGWPAAIQPSDPIARFDAEDVMIPEDELICDLA